MAKLTIQGLFEKVGAPDGALEARCAQAIARQSSLSEGILLEALADPRGLHVFLYDGLVPEDCREFLGRYRGSDVEQLKTLEIYFAHSDDEAVIDLTPPAEVELAMTLYAAKIRGFRHYDGESAERRLLVVADLMARLGKIHPFIDGNGHIQRITAQSLLRQVGFRMNETWRIHPRPYGEAMNRALAASDIAGIAALLKGFFV